MENRKPAYTRSPRYPGKRPDPAPPCDVILVGHLVEQRSRRFVVAAQGFVDDTMVFEGRVTGMVM